MATVKLIIRILGSGVRKIFDRIALAHTAGVGRLKCMTTSRSESINAVVKFELMNNGASFMNLLAAIRRIENRWSREREEADLDGDGLIAHGAQICPALAHLTRGPSGAAAMLVTNLNSARKWRCGWVGCAKILAPM